MTTRVFVPCALARTTFHPEQRVFHSLVNVLRVRVNAVHEEALGFDNDRLLPRGHQRELNWRKFLYENLECSVSLLDFGVGKPTELNRVANGRTGYLESNDSHPSKKARLHARR